MDWVDRPCEWLLARDVGWWVGLLTNLASAATIVGTILAVFLALRFSRPLRTLVRQRARELDSVLIRHGSGLSARGMRSAHRSRVNDALVGSGAAHDELCWLAEQLAPTEVDQTLWDLLDRPALVELADAYLKVAAGFQRASRLNPAQSVMAALAPMHLTTAARLIEMSASVDVAAAQRADFTDSQGAITVQHPGKGHRLDFWAYPGVTAGHACFDEFVLLRESPLTSLIPPDLRDASDDDPGRVAQHEFDGVLPALRSVRLQVDRRTGRMRLAMSVIPMRFSAIKRAHFFGPSQWREIADSLDPLVPRVACRDTSEAGNLKGNVDGSGAGLITCAFMPVTRDGYLLLAERGAGAGAHEGVFGPAVSGNMDLSPRGDSRPDRDADLIPQFKRAIAREAMEELGLAVRPETVVITGLCRFTSATEANSFLICSTAMLPHRLDELPDQFVNADLGEGRWEVGERLLGIQLPTPEMNIDEANTRLEELMSWLWSTADLPPFATASGWMALAAVLSRPNMFGDLVKRVASDPRVTVRASESSESFLKMVNIGPQGEQSTHP